MTKIAKPHKWTDEQERYIQNIVRGRSRKEIHEKVNKKFGLELTYNQVIGYMKRNKLKTGFTGRFVKGQESWNKGMKGVVFPGSEKGWFAKGERPSNYKPVGSERIDSQDGYILIKVSDYGRYQDRWKLKHKVRWEKEYGKIPDDHVIIFLDSDRKNCELSNLEMISRKTLVYMNKNDLFSEDPQLTRTGINLAKIYQKTSELKLHGNDKEEFNKHMSKAKSNGIKKNTFLYRLKRGWSLQDASSKPLNYRFSKQYKNRGNLND